AAVDPRRQKSTSTDRVEKTGMFTPLTFSTEHATVTGSNHGPREAPGSRECGIGSSNTAFRSFAAAAHFHVGLDHGFTDLRRDPPATPLRFFRCCCCSPLAGNGGIR